MKPNYWDDPIMAAKRAAYKDVIIPNGLKNKIEIYVKPNGAVAIRNIENMKYITEQRLKKLGFERQVTSDIPSFSYYTMDFKKLCLISNADDEAKDGRYYVEFFDFQKTGEIRSYKKLKKLVKILKSMKKT